MPPEIVKKKAYYPQFADIWSLGVLLYIMLYGNFPFRSNYENDLYDKIEKGVFQTSDIISNQGNNLIKKILKVNPLDRPSANSILLDEWFNN